MHDPINVDRRRLLQIMGSGALSLPFVGLPRFLKAEEARLPVPPSADTLILLWMSGGMAHTETFDPKTHVPFEVGMDPKKLICTFPAIPTSVDGIQFCSGLEHVAQVMDRGALIRSFQATHLRPFSHSRASYHWHTGYLPPLSVDAPAIGAVIARILGPRKHAPDVPANVDIGIEYEPERIQHRTAGFLGPAYRPFVVQDPYTANQNLLPRVGKERFKQRHAAYLEFVKHSPLAEQAYAGQTDALVESIETAYRFLQSPASAAFDYTQEPEEVIKTYDTGNRFGLGCLLARRLTEAGARFILVRQGNEHSIVNNTFDSHSDGHLVYEKRKKEIDVPIAQLVKDLESRDLLSRTLIVVASEFSRRVGVAGLQDGPLEGTIDDAKQYGLHSHYTRAGSVLLFGGGIKQGHLYGKTNDEYPCEAIDKPLGIEDLHATIYRAMGISAKHHFMIEQRPFYVTRDGKGKPIEELFAHRPHLSAETL